MTKAAMKHNKPGIETDTRHADANELNTTPNV
jgi:hypothetical protein